MASEEAPRYACPDPQASEAFMTIVGFESTDQILAHWDAVVAAYEAPAGLHRLEEEDLEGFEINAIFDSREVPAGVAFARPALEIRYRIGEPPPPPSGPGLAGRPRAGRRRCPPASRRGSGSARRGGPAWGRWGRSRR